MSGHVVIGGTGRAGTTFLVEMLAGLGLETGIEELAYYPQARAGLEVDVHGSARLPQVVKAPHLALSELLSSPGARSTIDLVLLPVRDLTEAANSRRRTTIASRWRNVPGGVGRVSPWRLEWQLAEVVHDLMLEAAELEIPVVPIHYPRMVTDTDYLDRRFREAGLRIERHHLEAVWQRCAQPKSHPDSHEGRAHLRESTQALDLRVAWNRRVEMPVYEASQKLTHRAKEWWWAIKDWLSAKS